MGKISAGDSDCSIASEAMLSDCRNRSARLRRVMSVTMPSTARRPPYWINDVVSRHS